MPAAGQSLCGTTLTTGAGQAYASAVTLTCNATVSDTGGGTIDFESTVDGAFGLATSTSGTTTFSGSVGGITSLTSLTIASGSLNSLPAINVNGNVSLSTTSGAITQGAALTANTLIVSSPGSVVLSNGGNLIAAVGSASAQNLILTAFTGLEVDGPVSVAGGSGNLTLFAGGALTVNTALAGDSVNLTGGSGIGLGNDVTAHSLGLSALNGSISQSAGTVTSSAACNVDAGGGNITFGHDVTCGTPAFTAVTTNIGGTLNFGAAGGSGVTGTVTGNYSQTGSLVIKAFADSIDQLAVTGSATLGGTLTVNFASVPDGGQNFIVLTAGSVSGTFASVNVTGLPSDRLATISYTGSSVVLAIQSVASCYVKSDATGAHDGSSWTDAYTDLQSALSNPGCHSIWVARGVYKPTATADRSIAFNLHPDMAVYGGFAGNEALFTQRDLTANFTVLSGDIDNNDTAADGVDADTSHIVGNNSYHVVVIDGTTPEGPITSHTILDGFTITGGQANGSAPDGSGGGVLCNGSGAGHACSPTLSNLHLSGNYAGYVGGAVYNDGSAGGATSPLIRDATFNGNQASNGGAVYQFVGDLSAPRFANVTFSGNSVSEYGGAIYNYQTNGSASVTMTNVTYGGNSAGAGGGAIADYNCGAVSLTSTLTNVILWGDSPGEVIFVCDTPTFKNSVVQGSGGSGGWQSGFGSDGTGNVDADPKLGPLQDNGGFAPTMMPGIGSSAIDAGLDSACTATPVNGLDQRAVARPLGSHCDIGAIEATRLSLSVNDGVAYGFYGRTLQYVVTLQNLSATDSVPGVHLSGLGTVALDGPNTLWFCTVGDCTTTQVQGPLADVATLVPNGTLTWLVNVPVSSLSTAASATMTIHSSGVGAASDTDTLAIFRATFDVP